MKISLLQLSLHFVWVVKSIRFTLYEKGATWALLWLFWCEVTLSIHLCEKECNEVLVSLEMIWPLWGWWSKNRFILDNALRLLSLWELRLWWYFIFLIFPFCHAKVSSILFHFCWFSSLKSIDIDELMISTSHL